MIYVTGIKNKWSTSGEKEGKGWYALELGSALLTKGVFTSKL